MKAVIYYMKPEAFGACCLTATLGTDALTKEGFQLSHEKVADLDITVGDHLDVRDAAWMQMQEPEGMRSMACGDVVEIAGTPFVCLGMGWRELT